MKKLLCMMLAVLMVLSLFAGCAGKETATETEAETKAETKAPEEEVQEEAPAASDKQTEISFITWRSEDADVLKAMIADFENQNPDIKVNLEITSSDITEYYTVLKSRLMSGEGADVLHVHAGPQLKELADAGYLLDLTDTGLAENVEPGILTAGQVNGTQYALTQTYNSFAIYCNTELFEELGIALPTDYASLLEACQKSVAAGYMPVSAGFGEGWVTDMLYEAVMSAHSGGDENIFHALETGDARLTDEKYQNIFNEIAQMMADGIFQDSASGTTYEGCISLFASGRATMLLDGTWSIGTLLGMNEDLKFDLVRVPSIGGESVGLLSPSQAVAINSNGKNIDAAQRFVSWLFTVEAEEAYCNGTVQASTVVGTALDVPEMDMVSELMQGETVTWPDCFVENAELLSIVEDLCGRIIAGSTDIMAELEQSQTEIDALIAG